MSPRQTASGTQATRSQRQYERIGIYDVGGPGPGIRRDGLAGRERDPTPGCEPRPQKARRWWNKRLAIPNRLGVLKTASHFNIGVALELRLKCLLQLKGTTWPPGKDGHLLAKLYSRLPPEIAKRLSKLFQESTRGRTLTLRAFIHSTTPPQRPADLPLDTVQDLFEYMDGDMALWEKRYSWETVSAQVWRHYLDDLRPLLNFVARIENVGTDEARKAGVIH